MAKRIIRVGSREITLAVAQTRIVMEQIQAHHPELELELVTMKTTGDKILDKALDKIGGKGLFVKELDRALREGRIDISVHSLKDMPMQTPEDLPILAYAKRGNPFDCLVLPEGVTESSARRRLQLGAIFPGAAVEPVRGNVQTRLRKLDEGQFSALVLAGAGLRRLGLEGRIARHFSVEEMLPAAGQGILAVQGRAGEDYSWLKETDDFVSRTEALAERAFVRELDGGCSSPIAAFAQASGEEVLLTGLYYHEEQQAYVTGTKTGRCEDAEQIGVELARELKGRFLAGCVLTK